jgi:hypothetical protein
MNYRVLISTLSRCIEKQRCHMYRICICTVLAFVVSLPAFSQTGNGALSGSHYNLNIIGVDKGKNPTLTSTDRHTIFVALGSKGAAVQTNIYLTQGPFQVCDGNGFDQAYDCNGNPISINGSNQLGAVFQLPCDTATVGGTTTGTCPSGTSQPYYVYAEALGTPGGSSTITTCAYDNTGTLVCSTDNAVLVRGSSKPKFTNVTTDLTTLTCTTGTTGCPCLTGTSCTYEIFDTNFEQFFWDYNNQGLRLAQVRFYPQ